MTARMLIDATQPEETRVVVQSGNRIEDFDYETDTRKQLKGNIYLAKVTRVEPSLQAAFVEYGGNRHGFLPFSEIHPDYYRIPISDRRALMAEEAAQREEDAPDAEAEEQGEEDRAEAADAKPEEEAGPTAETSEESTPGGNAESLADLDEGDAVDLQEIKTEAKVDLVGGDEVEDAARRRAKLLRRYKIQEVIKRRQIILVQVTKEERGNKGAALTTYLSLPGRYCVLMPNTAKGGGISRKISNSNDRRRLKKILSELTIPDGVAVIVRTAGAQRSKAEIRRDYEYLMRLWNEIRETTLQSTAPALIYEEANLIKRSIRDLYSREMDEIVVEGDEGYKAARAFMKSLMPSHARKVRQYKDGGIPLFHHHQVESQLDAMHSPVVQLPSGGYIVLNATEALVAIDVNSGKATRERNIEETALKTNVEAAIEVGRQLRLRDLAGLIVIDFIDMEETRHNRDVERKLKEALRHDRARIQLGRISPFGLLEMSRQRLRPSLFESSTVACVHCRGTGFVRTVESAALQVLRALEEEGIRNGKGQIRIKVPQEAALYLFNQKRARLVDIEIRHGLVVEIGTDDSLAASDFKLERLTGGKSADAKGARDQAAAGGERKRRRRGKRRPTEDEAAEEIRPEEEDEVDEESLTAAEGEATEEESDRPKKRRRRGKRGGRRRTRRAEAESEGGTAEAADADDETNRQPDSVPQEAEPAGDDGAAAEAEGAPSGDTRKRRPRRSTRRRPADDEGADQEVAAEASAPAPETSATPDQEQAPTGKAEAKGRRGTRGGRSRAKQPRKQSEKAAESTGGAEEDRAPSSGAEPEEESAPAPVAAEPAAAQPAQPSLAESPPGPVPTSGLSGNESPAEPTAPKRQGWWSRIVG